MKTQRITRLAGALTLAVLLGAPLANAQMTETEGSHQMQHEMMQGQQAQGMDMPAKCKAMMEKKHQMMQKCKMMDAKLDKLVAAMNTATGQEKVDAMAALLNELVQQRKEMHRMMMEMRGGMMEGEMSQGTKPKCKMMQKMTQQQTEAGGSGK